MDHHCYLINNCVGKYNYKYFLSYIFLAIINSGIIAILSYMNLKKYIKKLKEYYFKNKRYYPLKFQILIHLPKSNLVTLLLGIFSFCGLIYFFCFHIYLIYFNLTTLEMKFPQQRKKDEEDKKNKNFKEKINSIYDDNILNIFWPD
jgi:palmitoyltransferase